MNNNLLSLAMLVGTLSIHTGLDPFGSDHSAHRSDFEIEHEKHQKALHKDTSAHPETRQQRRARERREMKG